MVRRRKSLGENRQGLVGWYDRFHLENNILPNIVGEYGGIHFVRSNLDNETDARGFVVAVQDALTLIESTDPAAYRLVQREVRYIHNSVLDVGGIYFQHYRGCKIDFHRYYRINPSAPEYEWKRARLACTFVHEATHGRLLSLGVPYNRWTWMRVERLCVGREARFARHLHSDHYDFTQLVPAFDPARSHPYRGLCDNLKRMKRMWRSVLHEAMAESQNSDSPTFGPR